MSERFVYGFELETAETHMTFHEELDDRGIAVDYEYGGLATAGSEGHLVTEDEVAADDLDTVRDLYPLGVIDTDDLVYRIDEDASHLFDEDEYDIVEDVSLDINPAAGTGVTFSDL